MIGEQYLSASTLTSDQLSNVARFFSTNMGNYEAIEYLEAVIGEIRGDSNRKKHKAVDADREYAVTSAVSSTSFLKSDSTSELPISLILQIPEDMSLVSHIIGQKGSHINGIIETSGCKVQIEKIGSRPSDIFRHVFITGKLNNVYDAFQRICSRACEISNGSFMENTRLVAPNEMMGGIIGKGGSTVREVQEVSKVSKVEIQVEQEMNQRMIVGVYGRTIILHGNLPARNHAAYLLLRQMAQDRLLPQSWKGEMPTLMGSTSVASMTPHYAPAPALMGVSSMMGGSSMFLPAGGFGLSSSLSSTSFGNNSVHGSGDSSNPPPPPPRSLPPVPSQQTSFSHAALASALAGATKQVQIKIPSDKMCIGMIIGARGATVEELQRQTGCTIQIEKQEDTTDPLHRAMTISGPSMEHISAAADVIAMKVLNWQRTRATPSATAHETPLQVAAMPSQSYQAALAQVQAISQAQQQQQQPQMTQQSQSGYQQQQQQQQQQQEQQQQFQIASYIQSMQPTSQYRQF